MEAWDIRDVQIHRIQTLTATGAKTQNTSETGEICTFLSFFLTINYTNRFSNKLSPLLTCYMHITGPEAVL